MTIGEIEFEDRALQEDRTDELIFQHLFKNEGLEDYDPNVELAKLKAIEERGRQRHPNQNEVSPGGRRQSFG